MSKLENHFIWTGRDDVEDGEAGKRWHHVVNGDSDKGLSLVGFACDIGVKNNKGRIGAAKGPDAIRTALANQAFHSSIGVTDAGTVVAASDLDEAQAHYASQIAEQLAKQDMVIGLGGGHEIAWGSYNGLLQAKPELRIGILNFDAHFDLRKPAPDTSSGTPFRQIAELCGLQGKAFNYCSLGVAETANTQALFDYAKKSGTRYLHDYQCNLDSATTLLTDFLKEIDELYVTVCLDAFPAYVAPGVSAPSPLGISAEFVLSVLKWLGENQKNLTFNWHLTDIAEMNPDYDLDNRTAKLAARLIHEVVKIKFS